MMANLPAGRAAIGYSPFCHCGVDLFGPWYIKDSRKVLKRYGVLFTCTTMRAVYLDVACGTGTKELMHVFRRALARCWDIKMIVCDPGTNLVGASNLLTRWRKGWQEQKLVQLGDKKGTEFKFIVAHSQH